MNDRLAGSMLLVAGTVIAVSSAVALLAMPEGSPGTASPTAIGGSGTAGTGAPASMSGASPSAASPSPVASAAPSEPPATAPPTEVPSATPSTADIVDAFLVQLADALRTGDADFQLARLHPFVLARYGEEQCAAQLPRRADPSVEIKVLGTGPPEPWDYDTDGLAVPVEDAVPIEVDITIGGTTERRELHLTVDGADVRWFTDCGLPIDTPVP